MGFIFAMDFTQFNCVFLELIRIVTIKNCSHSLGEHAHFRYLSSALFFTAHPPILSCMIVGRTSPDQLLAVILPKIEAAREAKRRLTLRQEVRERGFLFGLSTLNHANPFRISCLEHSQRSVPPPPILYFATQKFMYFEHHQLCENDALSHSYPHIQNHTLSGARHPRDSFGGVGCGRRRSDRQSKRRRLWRRR